MQPIGFSLDAGILFPVDFSPRCRAVIPLVKAMAEKFSAKVTLLYAIQIPGGLFATEHGRPAAVDIERMLANAREELVRFYGLSAEPVEFAVDIGDPAHAIVEYAHAKNTGLIMLPTHGYGRFRGLLLGSIAAKVLHDAECPVWTAAHAEDTEPPARYGCKSILCALDLARGNADLLRHAVGFAARFDAQVRIVHAVAEALPGTAAMAGMGIHELLMESAREEIAKIQEQAGTALDVCVGAIPIADWIREVAHHHAADLVIIGRGHVQGRLGRLRTNAYNVIRQSPCPVLSV